MSRITLYTILSILVTGSYALAVSGLSLIAHYMLPTTQLLVTGFVFFVLAISIIPIHQKLLNRIEATFFRRSNLYQQHLQAFGLDLAHSSKISTIVTKLRIFIEENLHPSHMHVFVYDPRLERYESNTGAEEKSTTDLQFSSNSALAQELSLQKRSILVGNFNPLPDSLEAESAKLALLDAQLFAPLSGQGRLAGWIAMGPHQTGRLYSHNEISYLEAICHQAGLAIERAQTIANLEQRVRETDVLARIAQGINITLSFDDVLELIYAQTSQIVKADDFKVILASTSDENYSYVFFIEENERYRERENSPILARHGLEGLILRTQHSLVTPDFESECRQQGIPPNTIGLLAWMGVPLNAGAKTIGAISMGSRDPSIVYSSQQFTLLQAIADQTAGAIVKSRLLADSESKALQLATLNEIGRSLTSTLDINPLLNQIMQSSTEILNCEAGSLFMVDDQTGDLVFEVTVGPVAEHLIGHHLSAGTGIVGKSAHTGNPLIVNEVHKSEYWFSDPDKDTGFVTRDILVVPMKIKEKVLGVIEAINKRDGSPFTQDDEELLSTFASQAAIAIENARLYTQTDAALRSRVEELSLIQRFDRELNSNLDLNRSLEITLAWSLRQARAEAGMICVPRADIQDPNLSFPIIKDQGYTKSSQNQADSDISPSHQVKLLDVSTLEDLKQGLPVLLDNKVSDQNRHWIIQRQPQNANDLRGEEPIFSDLSDEFDLPGSQVKILIPIRRQSEVLAIMILESKVQNAFQQEIISVLTRISDHAAIAISNAQLYADLQAANIAKSDFISLVSHELKTPMTSIKGYTDLLAQESVGPVNEAQADFLNIIRSNTNRMATLVSDLTDISRIEAGRLRLEFSAVPFANVVDEVYRSIKAQIEHKQQVLAIDLAGDLPLLWGDFYRLTQIVSNLVSNAIKYTPEGGKISISASQTTVQDEAGIGASAVQIDIQDTGIGIPLSDQSAVFQKFFRSDAPEVRNTPGTGLGLNITRHLVNMQGGNIWFESEPGKGTRFSFTIPTTTGI